MEAAHQLLDLFASVGTTGFAFTRTNIHGDHRGFFPERNLHQAKYLASLLIKVSSQHNIIVRPNGGLIQLDDLSREKALQIHRHSFAVIQTSPRRYQAWLAVPDAEEDLRRRLCKGICADIHASGAVRLPGSRNVKAAYAPAFPTVQIVYAHPGHEVSQSVLEPFLAPKEQPATWVTRVSSEAPNYASVLSRAPKKPNGRADRSQADWNYAILALASGMNQDEVAATLLRESSKAKERKGRAAITYAERTARNAAISIGRHSLPR